MDMHAAATGEDTRLLAGMPQSRFAVFGIDDATLALARSLKPIIAPGLAAGFREHMQRLSSHATMGDMAKVHGGPLGSPLESALATHCAHLLEARFEDDYLRSLAETVSAEAQTPFGARAHCVLTLAAVRSGFVEIGRRRRFSGPGTARDCVRLVELLMIDLAISMDIVARKHDQQIVRRAAQIEDLTLGLRTNVSEVSKAASETSGLLNRVSRDCTHASRSAGQSMTASRDSLGRVRKVVAQTASATQQLQQSIGEIDRRTREGAGIAQEAVAAAGEAQLTIESLAGLVGEIGSVVSLISDIAAQTSLLALNATIEAARAGEAGRGFAVVASEVKNLSAQTTSATGTIAARIDAIRAATERCVGSIARIDMAVKGMADVSSAIAGALGEQLTVTQGMAQDALGTAGEVEIALDHVAQTFGAVQRVDASVEEMNAHSASVGQVTDELARSLNDFTAAVAERRAS